MATSYNPQEWGRPGPSSGMYVPHSRMATRPRDTRDATGMEASLPEPPPPYTAANLASPSSQQVRSSPQIGSFSPAQPGRHEYGSPVNTTASSLRAHQQAGTSQQSSPTFFPPPPAGQRDRSMSRSRGVLSNITVFANRHRPGDISSPGTTADLYQRAGPDLHGVVSPLRNQDGTGPGEQSYIPPAARRAVSVGAHIPSANTSRAVSKDRSNPADNNWEPGMPLPPPPPGPPPPSNSRSQSLNRIPGRQSHESTNIIAPVPSRAILRGTQLGPVPPTPADWVDEDYAKASAASTIPPVPQNAAVGRAPLQLNTQVGHGVQQDFRLATMSAIEPSTSQVNSAAYQGGISRSSGRRDPSAKGSIRERRSESRAARSREPQTAIEAKATPWDTQDEARPANLTLAPGGNLLTRRRHVAKSSSSPLTNPQPGSSKTPQERQVGLDVRSPDQSRVASGGGLVLSTPPFSAGSQNLDSGNAARTNEMTAIHSLPTPSSARTINLGSATPASAGYSSHDRHASNLSVSRRREGSVTPEPPPQTKPAAAKIPLSLVTSQETSSFAEASLERYRTFVHREASARSDRERLELFADFMVRESRLRRDRYAEAFEGLGGDVLDLTRDMWRSLGTTQRARTPSMGTGDPASRTANRSSAGSHTPYEIQSASSGPGSVANTPGTEGDSPGSISGQGRFRSDSRAQQRFQPGLSPIESMAMSAVPDDDDSRGRAPSRWWEGSARSGSVGDPGGRKVERSKRESKYMGVPREARENLQWDAAEPSPYIRGSTPGSSQPYDSLGPDEYPPEKAGWHDQDTPSQLLGFVQTAPSTPRRPKMDVSRLITLPPPYPRHHPAINNSHPDLAATRALLRLLTDRADVTKIREDYGMRVAQRSPRIDEHMSSADRSRKHRQSIQGHVARGEMSFAEAAMSEAGFENAEAKRLQETAQKHFNHFQSEVVSPLKAMFSERITKATAAIDQLRVSLTDPSRVQDPNQPQEEGDEQPELLEHLTLMKWFFEAREQLHGDLHGLQGESDEMYRNVILAPYVASNNSVKQKEVEHFFSKDARDRKITAEQAALARYDMFLPTVESTVTRGVENQLSAFWDIAPSLLTVVQKIPSDLSSPAADIHIPPQEYAENPSYEQHPLQYLYSLLSHTQKSAYQFIESQTNLLCLLHEVKTGVMQTGIRAMETQRALAGEDAEAVRDEMKEVRDDEDGRLTTELKERVQLVEDQWRQGLGNGIVECKARIESFLVSGGGWDDSLLD